MKGFYFLLFTISFLIMIQIQSGILQNISRPSTTSTTSSTSSTSSTSANSANSAHSAPSSSSSTKSTTTATTTFAIKKIKGGAPALSSLGSGSVLIFLTNTLIQLLHLS